MATETTALPKLYIGIDIHKESWSVHIRSNISDHKSFTVTADPSMVYDYVVKHFIGYQVA